MRMLSATQQTQEEVERTKQQLTFEIERIKQDSDMKVETISCSLNYLFIELLLNQEAPIEMKKLCFLGDMAKKGSNKIVNGVNINTDKTQTNKIE